MEENEYNNKETLTLFEEVKNILKGICPESFTRGHFKTSINTFSSFNLFT